MSPFRRHSVSALIFYVKLLPECALNFLSSDLPFCLFIPAAPHFLAHLLVTEPCGDFSLDWLAPWDQVMVSSLKYILHLTCRIHLLFLPVSLSLSLSWAITGGPADLIVALRTQSCNLYPSSLSCWFYLVYNFKGYPYTDTFLLFVFEYLGTSLKGRVGKIKVFH